MSDDVDRDSPDGRGDASAVIPAAPEGAGAGHLNRTNILGAAVVLIDRDGLRALTMRSLGTYLGVEAMAIYRHVAGRDALLDGIVETVVDELYGDPDVHLSSKDWQEYLYRLAHGVRRIALAHPQVFPLVATRPPAAPWVRPPLRSLRWIEAFLATLRGCGFSEQAAVGAYQAFTSFLIGHLLLEVAAQGVEIGPVEETDNDAPPAADVLQHYPVLASLQDELARDRAADEFDESLESLIDRLEATGKR